MTLKPAALSVYLIGLGLCQIVAAAPPQPTSMRWASGPTTAPAAPTTPAFPGAEGFGAITRGGRGGKVFLVTTLEDYDSEAKEKTIPGSLREAVEAKGPRIVVFGVSGNIELKNRLEIRHPFITIAGQTASGDGVCLKRRELKITAGEVIIRHLRVRPGDIARKELDGIWARGAHGTIPKNVILDHCSVSWAVDETISATWDADNITVQWCTIADALHNSVHEKGNHGYGSAISGGSMSFHHNLYANNRARNPRVGEVVMDFRNNVVYNWNNKAGAASDDEHLWMNYVANYIKPGPSTVDNAAKAFWGGSYTHLYAAGNFFHGQPDLTKDNTRMFGIVEGMEMLKQPVPAAPVKTDSAQEAYEKVMANVGATKPKRDSVDARLVEVVRENKGRHIDSQTEAGGWPELTSAPAPLDSDSDGIPDDWEKAHGLDPNDPSDASAAGADGYTNIERYINEMAGQ